MDSPFEDEQVAAVLGEQLVVYYQHMVEVHRNDPVVGACLICHRPRCEDWRFATERLIAGGVL